ncbi:MAG: hypothetical protein A2Z14_05965 [Chloroflexi bacterium RBG_16_48_8]|nr:MAG: hypothetical protein A2Z14_05965 [Chloroflexi bacterium RBG_16_48_8]
MESKAGRTWIVNAFVFFLPVLFLWVIAALWVGSSLGAQFKLFAGLQTSLLANYGPDSFNQSFKSLKLAIFGDVFSDSELPADAMTGLEIALRGPVPTATLRAGVLEWTSTPQFTITAEPFHTTIPTAVLHPISTPTKLPENTQTPIQTPTATASKVVPTATPKRDKVMPLLGCVKDNGGGSFTAFFGYENRNSFEVGIPIGEENKFIPDSKDRGQPVLFVPGKLDMSFQVEFNGEPLTWHLDSGAVTASVNSTRCDPITKEETKDTEPPQISEGNMDPPEGDLDVCSLTIVVDDLRVVDTAPSSGIAWVKLKYNVEGYTTDYIYSSPLTLCSGGPTNEGGWDGCYSGSIVISIDPNWASPDPEPFKINLFAKAQDNEGNGTCYYLGQYTMPACCGKCD